MTIYLSSVDHLCPNLPFSGAALDLQSTDPTQETSPGADRAGYMAPTRQRELDHTDQGPACPEISKSSSVNRSRALSEVWNCGSWAEVKVYATLRLRSAPEPSRRRFNQQLCVPTAVPRLNENDADQSGTFNLSTNNTPRGMHLQRVHFDGIVTNTSAVSTPNFAGCVMRQTRSSGVLALELNLYS